MNKHIAELIRIIKYEGEGRNIDFKAIEYKSGKFADLLKDILAMANSFHQGDRYIICGVKHVSDVEKHIVGIQGQPMDSAHYAQLIRENIEPEIHFEYLHFDYDGKILTAFVIFDCDDKPYMMKKANGDRRPGESFVRNVSATRNLMRPDIDRIFEERYASKFFRGEIDLYFPDTHTDEINITVKRDVQLPSEYFRRKATQVLNQKESMDWVNQAFNSGRPSGPIDQLALENLRAPEIRSIIDSIPGNFVQEDQFYQYEDHSFKLNATLLNTGHEYLRDVSLKITVEAPESLVIPDRIIFRQYTVNMSNGIRRDVHLNPPPELNQGYPIVTKQDGGYLIEQNAGDLKHGIPQVLFQTPIRLVITNPDLIGKQMRLHVECFGETLQHPVRKTLKVNFV